MRMPHCTNPEHPVGCSIELDSRTPAASLPSVDRHLAITRIHVAALTAIGGWHVWGWRMHRRTIQRALVFQIFTNQWVCARPQDCLIPKHLNNIC
ncbi:hypothetical protein HYPSUDRAFT_333506 [Hypholoma sublateritium FD-334 SS-4]|uniref:Uncharacterized protein n=1 Tax=Hypholoma sublateritium (strain FD-334 SS-4) TaxID=945553 RepID=A0A0D2P657_HYPSF|nr:hypothetical protein HYPSUDRAFT_333506 [Hypholoma sublateritium FD-334 SS-4]